MTGFFGSGLAFALILAGMFLELAILLTLYSRSGRGIPPRLLAGDFGAGMCLLAAAIAALRGAAWPVIAGALLLALAAHVFDLVQRWKR